MPDMTIESWAWSCGPVSKNDVLPERGLAQVAFANVVSFANVSRSSLVGSPSLKVQAAIWLGIVRDKAESVVLKGGSRNTAESPATRTPSRISPRFIVLQEA